MKRSLSIEANHPRIPMNANAESTQTLFYFLPRIFLLLILFFVAASVGLFVAFALNGGAAGSSEMNETSTIFSVIYILALVLVFWFVIKRLFPKRKDTTKIAPPSANETVSSVEPVNLTNANIIYVLQAVAIVFPLTMIISAIMIYLKINTVRGTWLETHFKWQIWTFWFFSAGYIVGMVILNYSDGGLPIIIANYIYAIYRITKGWIRLNDNKHMYAY